MRRFSATAALIATMAAIGLATEAQAYTVTIAVGTVYESTATFTNDGGGNLVIALNHSSALDVNSNPEVLTALFFDIAGVTLTPLSAIMTGTCVVLGAGETCPGDNNVGGEWIYQAGLSGQPAGAGSKGISAVGFGIFNNDPNFGGPALWDPPNIDGADGGIVSAGYTPAGDSGGLQGPLIKNLVTFTLSGLPTDFVVSASTITNVTFQFGTSFDDATCTEPGGCDVVITPDGGSMAMLLGVALMGLAGIRRFMA